MGETVLSSDGCYDENRPRIHVLLLASPDDLSRDAKTMYQRFLRSAGKSAVTSPTDAEAIQQRLATGDILVDAILGTGLSTPVTGLYRDAIEAITAVRPPDRGRRSSIRVACRYRSGAGSRRARGSHGDVGIAEGGTL
jgi:NAD(P)H-hydrate repair Nnr-like enzyme with NAD(P)H-hydrate epimerase domain